MTTADSTANAHREHTNNRPPMPPRWRTLKRSLLTAGVIIASMILLRLAWGCEANRRLQAKIAEYRAAGYPVLIEDIVEPEVADEENAAEYYKRAHAALVETIDQDVTYIYGDPEQISVGALAMPDYYPNLLTTEADAVRRLLDANAETLRLMREARRCAAANWGIELRSPLILNLPRYSLVAERNLAKLACGAADFHHAYGEDAHAVELLRDALAVGKHLCSPRGLMLPYLVATGTSGLTVTSVERITATLTIGDTGSACAGEAAEPASRNQVMALIAELLNDEPHRLGWQYAILSERVITLDTLQAIRAGECTFLLGNLMPPSAGARWEAPVRWVLEPLFILDAIVLTDHWTALHLAGNAPNWPEALDLAPSPLSLQSQFERRIRCQISCLGNFSDPTDMLQRHYQTIARRRLAATALALRLYELDRGHRPALLAELTPDYIDTVPEDPFMPNGEPLRYAPDRRWPLLYSIGRNGKDDSGYEYTSPEDMRYGWMDLPFYLDGQKPPREERTKDHPANSPQTADYDADVQDDPGDTDEQQPGHDHPG
ncbi:MAG: hypothetical protein ABIG44_10335 [Planctomycetota bacterium]